MKNSMQKREGSHGKGKKPDPVGGYEICSIYSGATQCFPSRNVAIRKGDPVYHIEIVCLLSLETVGNHSHSTDESEMN